jgi:hypothetical protein
MYFKPTNRSALSYQKNSFKLKYYYFFVLCLSKSNPQFALHAPSMAERSQLNLLQK